MSICFTAYGLRTAAYVHMGLHMVCIYAHTRMQCACNVICSARGAAGRPLRARAANNVPRKDNRERCDDDRKLEIAGKPLDGTG